MVSNIYEQARNFDPADETRDPDSDPVTAPDHYRRAGIECIDVIEAFELNFRLANVVKYVLRHKNKGDPLQDLLKAKFYLDREIEKAVEADDGK